MKVLPVILLVLAVAWLVAKAVNQRSMRLKCKNSAEGKLIGMDDSFVGMGSSPGTSNYSAIYYPIYEYVVNGMAYWAQLNKYRKNPSTFAKVVTVFYDPDDPDICFINKEKGKIISTYNKDEYDMNSGGKNLTADYKWRP